MRSTTVTIGGKRYELTPPGKEELRLLDKFVIKHRRSVLQLAKDNLEGLSADLQQALLRDALQIEAARSPTSVTPVEYGAVLDTREGCAYLFWLMMKRTKPDLTLDEVEEMIQDATDDEFARLIEERDKVQEHEPEQLEPPE